MLPEIFENWFAARGWQPRAHQLALVAHAGRGESVLLVAPTGGGKTLAGFLPSLIDLAAAAAQPRPQLHTLYISPLKALAVDVARNLETPIAEMDLPVPRRDPHRRYAAVAPRSASAMPRPTSCSPRPNNWRCCSPIPDAAKLFEGAQDGGARRIACALQFQARRSAGAWVWRGLPFSRPVIAGSACRRRWPTPSRCSAFSCRSRRAQNAGALVRGAGAARRPKSPSAPRTPMCPGPGIWRAMPWPM